MKQILQDLRSGETQVAEIPSPQCRDGHVLIGSRRTLVSAGTERMLVEFGEASYLEKARQQPERVKKVIDKIKTDGLIPTVEAVQSKLDRPLPLGYCQTGIVLQTGEGVHHVEVGDRVVSNGHHAEVVSVPKNLVAPVPEGVSDDETAFTVAGAIALQSIRLAEPTLGETFVVSGLGLIGLLAVQLLRANGCEVLGIDFKEERLAIAESFGAETVNLSEGEAPVAAGKAFSKGRGVDGVIVAASTKSSDPIHQAAQMCRKRGRVVLVGVTGLELDREDFYEKEISFQVSCSYGPGRYDKNYEEQGLDYPIGFVRWTEQRNFEAVLQMMERGALDVEPLISERHPVEDATQAYEAITGDSSAIGVLLEYPNAPDSLEDSSQKVPLERRSSFDPGRLFRTGKAKINKIASEDVVVGAIGAGNYASRTLFPALESAGVRLKSVASTGGLSSHYAGEKFGFEEATTDVDEIFADGEINTVIVATRHNTHAEFVCRALEQGKHVFVEKPLSIDRDGLERIERTYEEVISHQDEAPLLMVGFNRRFAPHIEHIRELLENRSAPPTFIMTVNAGEIPSDHWTQDPKLGGGRIIGEGCHFVDLLRDLADSPIERVQSMKMGSNPAVNVRDDKMTVSLGFESGAIGSVHYLANGSKSFPKERLEVFCGGGILQLDNFRKLDGFDWPGLSTKRTWSQNKGNEACIQAFVRAINEGAESPIPFQELVEVTEATFRAAEQA